MPLNQHSIKSEYAKSFRTYRESAQAEYTENMKFRRARRHQEVTHQPWAWLDVGISEDETDSERDRTGRIAALGDRRSSPVEVAGDARSTDTNSDFDASGGVEFDREPSATAAAAGAADERLLSKLKHRALQRAAEMQAQTPGTQLNQSNSGPRRPHHPVRGSPGTASTRVAAAASASRPRRDLRTIMPHKPFLSYGWGARSNEASRKETFNIRSDIDVHPSATRAMRSRESLLQHQLEQQQQRLGDKTGIAGPESGRRPRTAARLGTGGAHSARSARRDLELDNRAAMQWLSEYRLQFPIYDNDVYRRGLANLAPRGHSARLDGARTCRI